MTDPTADPDYPEDGEDHVPPPHYQEYLKVHNMIGWCYVYLTVWLSDSLSDSLAVLWSYGLGILV